MTSLMLLHKPYSMSCMHKLKTELAQDWQNMTTAENILHQRHVHKTPHWEWPTWVHDGVIEADHSQECAWATRNAKSSLNLVTYLQASRYPLMMDVGWIFCRTNSLAPFNSSAAMMTTEVVPSPTSWSCRSASSQRILAAGCSTSNSFKMVAPSLVTVTSWKHKQDNDYIRGPKNWFMHNVRLSSYGCMREVGREREKRKSCMKRSWVQL